MHHHTWLPISISKAVGIKRYRDQNMINQLEGEGIESYILSFNFLQCFVEDFSQGSLEEKLHYSVWKEHCVVSIAQKGQSERS
jgi:hypothetical protein